MQYDQTANVDELNGDGTVTRHETLEMWCIRLSGYV
jgi:hypothetical protein